MKRYTRLSDIQADVANDALTIPDLVDSYLARIQARHGLNAFLEVYDEEARASAQRVQDAMKAGTAGRLAGAVIAVKDNICLKDHKVSCASHILGGMTPDDKSFASIYTATALQRLMDEDAIIIGRTNCDEFAMGSSNENSAYGPVKNPLDETKVPGGSSGGSAAAVAADLCLISLGSDTGGSIRQPASFCGVVGMKPTYGRVSRYGLIAYASSFDQIGPFTHSIEDAALVTEILSGKDEMDSTSSSKEVGKMSAEMSAGKKYRIAYLDDCINSQGVLPEVRQAMDDTVARLRAEGHTVETVDFPYLEHMVPTYYVLTTAEASSNLARFDGIHFGHRSEKATDIDTTYIYSRTEGFGEEVKRRIMLGTFVLSAGFYDAYYAKAMKVRRIIQEATDRIFEEADIILLPSTPATAFGLDSVKDPITMYLQDIFTVQANLAGVPAISLPMFKDKEGLPFGLQLMSRRFEEATLFGLSAQLMAGIVPTQ